MKRPKDTLAKAHGTLESVLLFDIGNTHTHVGLAQGSRIIRQENVPTPQWSRPAARRWLGRFAGSAPIEAAALCSVVPQATPLVRRAVSRLWGLSCFELSAKTLRRLGIDYPHPQTIGPDRLANAVEAATADAPASVPAGRHRERRRSLRHRDGSSSRRLRPRRRPRSAAR